MAKRVAIIDIGSNSTRLVIFQRTSRFGFHLIAQKKAAVRISAGSFENGGNLTQNAIARTIEALSVFQDIIKDYKARKILIVATAAVRNAPNRSEFISKVREQLKLNIKVIDGDKEAYYGAISAKNLLPVDKDFITVDIGGGSSDIALIKENKVIDTISLNIGTITIKELFVDKNASIEEASEFILKELDKIPSHFASDKIVAIGGVLRAFAKAVMKKNRYSFGKIHAFEYDISKQKDFIEDILNAKNDKALKKLYIKTSRLDTIKEGLLIFKLLLEKLGIKDVISSGVGIREGVFLHDMLRGSNHTFPREINPSIVSIVDRFDILNVPLKNRIKIAKNLYKEIAKIANFKKDYLPRLIDAIKISNSGKALTIYSEHKHAYYIASQELNWKYTHEDMILISTILRSKNDKLIYEPLFKEHEKLLPSFNEVKWLSFIYSLSDILHSYSAKESYNFILKENQLEIVATKELYLLESEIKDFDTPIKLEIIS